VPVADSDFLSACWCEPVARTPVWFMRQAGRSLPEFRARRGASSILEAVRDPELAAELTCQPVRRYGVDAAILFSDIMVPYAAIGCGITIVPGSGPVVDPPFRAESDLKRLRPLEPGADTPYVLETIRRVVESVPIPVIGFAGAPFTIASYLVEGGPSRDFVRTKALMHTEPGIWFQLVDRLAGIAIASLRSQVQAGVQAIQLFDSWVGGLSRADYERFVLPATRRILEALADLAVPRIVFGVGTGEILDLMAAAGADVVGVDWRVPLDRAAARVGDRTALQGNLDPAICLAGSDAAEEATRRILAEGRAAAGHVFNLGHGVLPETEPGVLQRLVELVHTWVPGEGG
jgi:uroporphyrinogen decarboxylase